MAFDQETGTVNLRKEVIDKVIRDIAKPQYKFKQALSIVKTGAWKNTFFRGSTTVLSGGTGNAIRGIPRGANFPQAVTTLEEVNSWIEKYGLEDFIHFEDIQSNEVNIKKRTLFKLTQGVVKAVDDENYSVLTEGGTVVNIQSITIVEGANSGPWNSASAAIIDDLMNASQLIGVANYDTSNLMMFVNHRDHRSIMNYLAEKGAQFPSVGEAIAKNGKVGGLATIKNIVVSNSVAASRALVVVPKICGNWKESLSLRSDVKDEAFKGTRIRVCEMGVTQLTDPKAVVYIINTQRYADL